MFDSFEYCVRSLHYRFSVLMSSFALATQNDLSMQSQKTEWKKNKTLCICPNDCWLNSHLSIILIILVSSALSDVNYLAIGNNLWTQAHSTNKHIENIWLECLHVRIILALDIFLPWLNVTMSQTKSLIYSFQKYSIIWYWLD